MRAEGRVGLHANCPFVLLSFNQKKKKIECVHKF
jgi:hypothetical protein